MHHRTIEQLAAGQGPVHRLDPRVKLVAVLAFVVVVAITPARPLWLYAPAAMMVLAFIVVARLPLGFVLSRTLMVLPFVLVVAIFLPFTRGTEVLARWDAAGLTLYREGTELALAILARGTLAILAVGWLVFTTPFRLLLAGLRGLGAPRVVVAILSFLFRYLDLLADESLRVRRARAARTPGRTVRWRGRSTGGLVGRLLLRALDRAERVHRAMVARCFDGEVRTLRVPRLRRADVAFLLVAVVLLTGMAAFGQLTGGTG